MTIAMREPIEHELKTWPVWFADLWRGAKRAEIRLADRDYRVGDFLRLREYYPATARYSGDWLLFRITHITPASPALGLLAGHVMLSLSECLESATWLSRATIRGEECGAWAQGLATCEEAR